METRQYIFAGKNKSILSNKREINEIITRFSNSKLLNLRINLYNKKFLKQLDKYDYLVCKKPLGYKYLLFLTHYNNEPYALFIDIKRNIIIQDFITMPGYFNNTLFTGYLNKIDKKWTYIIEDILLENGYDLFKVNFIKRLNKISNILKLYKKNIIQSCNIDILNYYSLNNFKKISNNNNSYIFKPVDSRNPFIMASKYYTKFKYNFDIQHNPYDASKEYIKCLEDDVKERNKINIGDNTDHKLNNICYNLTIKSHASISNIYECYCGDVSMGLVRIIDNSIINLIKKNINKVFKCKYNSKFKKWCVINTTNEIETNYNDINPELLI